jgi:UDP-N-acetyl-D-glucosamine dehydrogenase
MYFENLQNKILSKEAIIGIIGLGYIGLPLGLEFVSKGFNVIGFDIDEMKIRSLNNRKTYIKHICEERIKEAVDSSRFKATTDFTRLTEVDAILICVPTPLNDHRGPEMKYIRNTAKEIQKYRKKGQLISLESTTYPGTTEEMLLPMFEDSKFKVGEDYFLAYSPEREDPNNSEYTTAKIPKVVSGITEKCKELATALYNHIVIKTIPVSSTKTAEATRTAPALPVAPGASVASGVGVGSGCPSGVADVRMSR